MRLRVSRAGAPCEDSHGALRSSLALRVAPKWTKSLQPSRARITVSEDRHSMDSGMSEQVVAQLVESHARFLAFVERRVGSRAAAEDILQEAFTRALTRGDAL